MLSLSFRTIQQPSEGLFKEKGSKFLAFAFPVQSEDEVKDLLTILRKKYFDARHHCYAYRLGADKKLLRANDDGEPNHSAGDPILGQIKSRDLTNVLVVVVRYFGGTKLGVGGLIEAYRTASIAALDRATIIEVAVTKTISIRFNYDGMPEVMKVVKDFGLAIRDQDFSDNCRMTAEYKLEVETALTEKLTLLQQLKRISSFEGI